jgi:hypothetical protein
LIGLFKRIESSASGMNSNSFRNHLKTGFDECLLMSRWPECACLHASLLHGKRASTALLFTCFISIRSSSSFVGWEVRVTRRTATIPHTHVGCFGQRPSVGESFYKVGIWNVRPAEGNHVGVARSDGCLSGLLRVAAVADESATVQLARVLQRERLAWQQV